MSEPAAPLARPIRPGCCSGCGLPLAPAMLACPGCQRLVHSTELARLAQLAQAAEAAQDLVTALAAWRAALALLPPTTQQHTHIQGLAGKLAQRVDRGESGPRLPDADALLQPAAAVPAAGPGAPAPQPPKQASRAATVGGALLAAGLLAWKLKAVLAFALTKGKLLLLGLTKASTFYSMLLAIGVYLTIWGWQFAVGIVLSIYVHEMGHISALRRFGYPTPPPMFIPGLGAVIRMRQRIAVPLEEARIGLAGPFWGLAAATVAMAAYYATGAAMLGAIGKVSAFINLFNLLPVWQLDGSHGFASLRRAQRWGVTAAFAAAWVLVPHAAEDPGPAGLLVLLAIVGVLRCAVDRTDGPGDRFGFIQFLFLIATLSALASVPIATPVL